MQQRVITFFKLPFWLWWNSLTDLRSYLTALGIHRGQLLWSLVVIYCILGSLDAVVFSTRTLPRWQDTSHNTWKEIAEQWPSDSTLQYSPETGLLRAISGAANWNVSWPESLEKPSSAPQHLARVQLAQEPTAASNSTEATAAAEATALVTLTPTALVSTGNSAQAITWQEMLSGTVSETETYTAAWAQSDDRLGEISQAWVAATPVLIALYWLMSSFGVLLLRLVSLVFYAWIAQSLANLLGVRFAYATAYKLGLITLIAPETIMTLWRVVYQTPAGISLWWIWMGLWLVVIWYFRRSSGKDPANVPHSS